MKVLGKRPEKLFLLDIPFEVTRTTKHAISAEDSSCVSPLYERKATKSVLHQLAHFWGPCSRGLFRLSGSRQASGLPPQGAAVLPELTVELMATNTAAWGRPKDLQQLPENSSDNRTHISPG